MKKTKDLKQDDIQVKDLKDLFKVLNAMRKRFPADKPNVLESTSSWFKGYSACLDDILKIIN